MATRTRKTTAAAAATAAPSADLTFPNFITELLLLCTKYSDTVPAAETVADAAEEAVAEEAPAPKTRRARGKAAATTAPEPEADDDDAADDDDDAEPTVYTLAEVKGKTVAALRKMLKELDTYAEEDVDAADKETLIAALTGQADDEEDEDDEDADDAPADDADADTTDADDERAEYEEMTIADLRKIARDDFEAEPSEIKGMKKGELIDFIMAADDDEADDDSADDGDEEDGYTEEELASMKIDELLEIAEEWEIDTDEVEAPKRMIGKAAATYKEEIIELILTEQDA